MEAGSTHLISVTNGWAAMTDKSLEREEFGTTAAGETVYRVRIAGGGLKANILTWGAVIQQAGITID